MVRNNITNALIATVLLSFFSNVFADSTIRGFSSTDNECSIRKEHGDWIIGAGVRVADTGMKEVFWAADNLDAGLTFREDSSALSPSRISVFHNINDDVTIFAKGLKLKSGDGVLSKLDIFDSDNIESRISLYGGGSMKFAISGLPSYFSLALEEQNSLGGLLTNATTLDVYLGVISSADRKTYLPISQRSSVDISGLLKQLEDLVNQIQETMSIFPVSCTTP